MKIRISFILLVLIIILFGSTTLMFYNKIYKYETAMNTGIQDTLRDSALFFENDQFDVDYVEPLSTLQNYSEMQYSYMKMTSNSDIYSVGRILQRFAEPDLYNQLSSEQKLKIAQYLRQMADGEIVDFEKDLLSFLNELLLI